MLKIMQNTKQRLMKWAMGVLVLLVVPFTLTHINPTSHANGGAGGGWDWSNSDFVFAFVVLFGAAAVYELVARRMQNSTYRMAVGLAVLTGLALVWGNAAVGIIGEDEWPNLLYLGVILLGFIGAAVSRFKPRGLSRTMFAMAVAVLLVPTIVLFVARPLIEETPGIVGVFALSSIFALLFAGSALLFRRASTKAHEAELAVE